MKSTPVRPSVMVFLAVLLVGMVFAAITQHAWEDYWITFRASKNLATGHGLVFVQGERLQTYTSPLGVLLPAFFSWITGNRSDELALWLFRLASLSALATGVVLFFQVLRSFGLRPVSCLLAVALIGLDAKTVDFSTNGMETGILIFFLALSIHGLLVEGPRRILRLGLGWAGLMWTRPDSFIYIGILALSALIFLPDRQTNRNAWCKKMATSGLICAVLYLPWVLWAWHYYGSPIPNTVVAKASIFPLPPIRELVSDILSFPLAVAAPRGVYQQVFAPTYFYYGGWHFSVVITASYIAFILSFVWLIPLLRPQTRLFSLVFFLGLFYLGVIVRGFYPWYLPSVSTMGFLTLGLLFDDALSFAGKLPQLGWDRGWFARLALVLRSAGSLLVAGQLIILVCAGREMFMQQVLIEDGLRRPIGMWLREHAQTPHDTVMVEPLGYVGYFSQLKMLDYPGLSSKEVVETRRRLGPDKQNLAYLELKPDWIVLRPNEAQYPNGMINPEHLGDFYDLVVAFDVSEKIAAVGWLPGRDCLLYDQTFQIYHRKPTAN